MNELETNRNRLAQYERVLRDGHRLALETKRGQVSAQFTQKWHAPGSAPVYLVSGPGHWHLNEEFEKLEDAARMFDARVTEAMEAHDHDSVVKLEEGARAREAVLRAALEKIAALQPTFVEDKKYAAAALAWTNGVDCGRHEAAEIARAALAVEP